MTHTIHPQEGLAAMWRGTTASLLISVPMVGIYMPLYDHLLGLLVPHTGATAAPILAGSVARTFAVFAVAPFELLRTRLQAAPAGAGPLRLLAPAPGEGGGGGVLGAVRRVPQLWTGLSATLMRDVPFSALYWAMVEPIRTAMLPAREHLHIPGLRQRDAAGAAGGAPAAAAGGAKEGAAWELLSPAHAEAASARGGTTTSSSSGSSGSSGSSTLPPNTQQQQPGGRPAEPHFHHTQSEILFANMVSGFIAGGLAAAATTPFDVAKTRMQIAGSAGGAATAATAAAGVGSSTAVCETCPANAAGAGFGGAAGGGAAVAGRRPGVLAVMREVYAVEGVGGMFTGVKPRAYRAAPACAIVISCYEYLKRALTPE
jgi:hypothetical protein